METISRSERLRKLLCGSCLVAAPAALLVGSLLHPTETTDASRQYEIIASDADRWELSHWFISAAMLLMVGAVLGLAHLLHEQRPAEGILGGAVALTGAMALFAVAVAETIVIPELGRATDAASEAIYVRIFEFGSTRWTVLLVSVLLLPAGLAVMSYGLYRARVVPVWTAVAIGFGAVAFAVSLPTGSAWISAIGLASMLAGMAAIGWTVLSEADAQWMHPPLLNTRPAT